ncbi:MAG TPA: dihydrodipicolinate synthase family protein [Thermomicrobiales bacterium]|nr:dihydrodipicolinate synthase family protein [Thermomicrobiales bacterium]
MAGCTADTTDDACRLVEMASRLGAVEVMVAPPRRPDWTRDELREHFGRVVAATSGSVMIQDAPFATGVELGVEFVLELAESFSNVGSYKVEALPYWSNAVRARQVAGERLRVLGGHGGLYLLDVLDSGADGLIPGCDVTRHLVDAWAAFEAGDRERADRLYQRILPFLVYEAQSLGLLVGGAKALLKARGVIANTASRLPDARLSNASLQRLKSTAVACGLLPGEGEVAHASEGGRGAR